MKTSGMALPPASRLARAPAVAIRSPRLVRRKQRTLYESLVSAGIIPRGRAPRPRGLLRRWFEAEAFLLAAFNSLSSIALLMLAMTMTVLGMQLAIAFNIAATTYVVLNDGLPYAGFALIVGGVVKALHTYAAHRQDRRGWLPGFIAAVVLLSGGLWLEVMLGYASFAPLMFKPILSLAGGSLTEHARELDKFVVAFFEPAMVALVGFLLAAKQVRTANKSTRHRIRSYLATIGFVASGGALIIGLYAAQRHYFSQGTSDLGLYAIGGDTLSASAHDYGSLFAPGVRCRVSDIYGMRKDPMNSRRQEDHMGVDIAVARGTPIHAMADGQVIMAKFDRGLGNMVALQVTGARQPVLVAGHMQKSVVTVGNLVKRGDLIGYAGSTGRSTGPHVHLQVCPDGRLNRRGLACGRAENPYEVWATLAALARMSCSDGPAIY